MQTYDPNTPCPACENEQVFSHYVPTEGVIRRQCARCGYTFSQSALNDNRMRATRDVTDEEVSHD